MLLYFYIEYTHVLTQGGLLLAVLQMWEHLFTFPPHPASYVSPSIPLHRHSSKLSGIALTVSRSLVTYYSLMWIRSDLSSSTLWGGIPSVSGFCSFELCYNTHPWTVQFQSRRGSWMFFITSHNFTVETRRIRKGKECAQECPEHMSVCQKLE